MPAVSFQSLALGVAQLATTDRFSLTPVSAVWGVGHEPRSVPTVRGTDARSRHNDRPEGIATRFQVSLYKVEPHSRTRARNLFSKHDARLALLDEMEPCGPKVPLVSKPKSFACFAVRLARTGSGPPWARIRPPGEPEGVTPDSNAGEEVALAESCKVGRSNIDN